MILTIITSIFAVSAISTNATSSQAPTLRADLTYSRSTTGNRATYPDIKAYVQDKYSIRKTTRTKHIHQSKMYAYYPIGANNNAPTLGIRRGFLL